MKMYGLFYHTQCDGELKAVSESIDKLKERYEISNSSHWQDLVISPDEPNCTVNCYVIYEVEVI
jgi:hypothetical protein